MGCRVDASCFDSEAFVETSQALVQRRAKGSRLGDMLTDVGD